MSSPAATCTDFDQCEHGQTSRAPTRIVALRMDGLHTSLVSTPGRGRCSHGKGGHETLLGYDAQNRVEDGQEENVPARFVQVFGRCHSARSRAHVAG